MTGFRENSRILFSDGEGTGLVRDVASMFSREGELHVETVSDYRLGDCSVVFSTFTDHRDELTVKLEYGENKVLVEWEKKGERDNFDYRLDEDKVAFEELFFFLSDRLEDIASGKLRELEIFFPQILFFLKESGLPLSWSSIAFNLRILGERSFDRDGLPQKATGVGLRVASFFLRSLLPENRIEFNFWIGFHRGKRRIVEFDDTETRYVFTSSAPAPQRD